MSRKHPAARIELLTASTRFTRALEKRVRQFVQRQRAFRTGERVVMGVSGGPDSTVLAVVLARLRDGLGIQAALAHFDHMLRSRQEAEEDARYLRWLAGGLGLAVSCGQGDVRMHARAKGLSLEEAGRELRYAFLKAEAERLDAGLVALGHTASDQAETVLMHIIRGSGLDGLVGMRPRSPWPWGQGPDLVRPLLGLWRPDTERYCRELGLGPRRDPSNELLEATRNRLRHVLLPLLRELNPGVEEALVRLAWAAAGDVAHLDRQADELWRALAHEEAHSVRFSRRSLVDVAPALATRLLRRAVQRLGGRPDLEAAHLQAMLEGLKRGRARLSLPQGLVFQAEGREVGVFSAGAEAKKRAEPIPETPLAVPGRTELPGWTVEADLVARPRHIRTTDAWEAFLDAEAVAGGLRVRSRRPGDRLRPLGLGGEKKVQDLLVDAKVAVEERDGVPIVCAPWGVVWVVGHRIDERAAVGTATSQVVHLRFIRKAPSPRP